MFIKVGLNLRSMETIKAWGEKLMRQHRPEDLLALPEFMRPHKQKKSTASTASMPLPTSGGSAVPLQASQAKDVAAAPVARLAEEPAKRMICTHCGVKISVGVARYCTDNSKRFGGLVYCMEHQALFPSASR